MHPLIAESSRSGTRIRLVLRASDGDTRVRIVEGIVLAVSNGRDGRARLRMGIPTGSGDPVEVRVLLEGVVSVERVDGDHRPSGNPTPSDGTQAHGTRRATIAFGSDSGIQRTDNKPPKQHDSWDDLPSEGPQKPK